MRQDRTMFDGTRVTQARLFATPNCKGEVRLVARGRVVHEARRRATPPRSALPRPLEPHSNMRQEVIVGAIASLMLAATAPQAAQAALVFAKLSTTQDESIDQGVSAVAPADAIVDTLNVVWSEAPEESYPGHHGGTASHNTSANSNPSQPHALDDPAMSLGDSAPSLASTLDARTFATAGDHRPVEIGFAPSVSSSTTDSTPSRDSDETRGGTVAGRTVPVAVPAAKEAAPLLDLGLLPALLGIVGATAFGFVATRRRLGKS